ncbi:MAG: DNA repair protein RadA [Ruminococcaceae bacterium]|nr:DNA repair protein RadA [Oscillospiraceae bacterium]
MKQKKVYVCTECDYQSPKWLGKCPSCGSWNTFTEETYEEESTAAKKADPHRSMLVRTGEDTEPEKLSWDELPEYIRSDTGMTEFDRVLGGGLVEGSVVLLSGEPGIGKSTLLLQICAALSKTKTVLYVSGEESSAQLAMRAKRLDVKGERIYVLTETNAQKVISKAQKLAPDIIIVDSIQTMYHVESASVPGSVTQIRECASMFINKAKTDGTSVLLVGHVNKEGTIAGPKILEHMVDTVLYFEGERRQNFRIIRAMKNRFGSTNEIGVFEMRDTGLAEVQNPSEMLLADRPQKTSGNCAVCVIEGTRPIIAEIQALCTPTVYPAPRRMSTGIDFNRVALILAVLEKRLGLRFSANDVYLNVIGGIRIEETASDIGMAMALISSIRDIEIPDDLLCFGELGLAGECRAVMRAEDRIKESARLGFRKIVVPYRAITKATKIPEGVEVIAAKNVFDLLPLLRKKEN